MVLYTIKNLLPIKDILKTLTSSIINNYIKILKFKVLEKNRDGTLLKRKKIK